MSECPCDLEKMVDPHCCAAGMCVREDETMSASTGLPIHYWSMASAIEQIERCEFECEGGPIKNNDAWLWLASAAKIGPEFWPGQGAWFEVVAEAASRTLAQWVHFYIVGAHMSSDSERRFWTYDLSYDPPAPYHYGTVHFQRVAGDKLRLEKPARLTAD